MRWGEYAHLALEKNEFYFTSPIKFNDPFDCQIPPSLEVATDAQLKKSYTRSLTEVNPEWSKNRVKKEARNFREAYEAGDWTRIATQWENAIALRFGILSLTTISDSLLMWSHYADKHEGVCVGLDKKRLDSFVQGFSADQRTVYHLAEVDYVSEYPVWNFFKAWNNDSMIPRTLLTSKSDAWRYEGEWRLIKQAIGRNQGGHSENASGFSEPERKVPLGNKLVREVIVGLKARDDVVSELMDINAVRNTRFVLKRARRSAFKFALEFDIIN